MALRTPPALVGGGGDGGEVDGGLEAQGSLSGSREKPPYAQGVWNRRNYNGIISRYIIFLKNF